MKERVAIIGASTLGRLMAHHLSADNRYEFVGFFDDYAQPKEHFLGKTDLVEDLYGKKFDSCLVAIGYAQMQKRKQFFDTLEKQIKFATFIHHTSYVDPSCKVGAGTFIFPGCVIDANANIGNNVTFQVGCIVAHDSNIGDHTYLGPGVNIAGFVTIGKSVFLGLSSVIRDGLTIGDGAVVGTGSLVLQNVLPDTMVYGHPAKFKRNVNE
jgi:sugar O-acyltransferase (sialic acid O-acetyltransferase NeuD family)